MMEQVRGIVLPSPTVFLEDGLVHRLRCPRVFRFGFLWPRAGDDA
jgi:hypothetical protein